MKIEKLLWSSTKVDILKYLIFRRQGVSIRALESELSWSFPAIKKQVDILLEADIIDIDKNNNKWSIYINKHVDTLVRKVFLYSLEYEIWNLFLKYDTIIPSYYLWKLFWNNTDADIVVVYTYIDREAVDYIKREINELFRWYFIEIISMVFMSKDDFLRRYRLADKFVLSLINYEKINKR